MVRTIIVLLASGLAWSQTYRLRNPDINSTFTVVAIGTAAPAQLTFAEVHNLTSGDWFSCNGFSGLPQANGIRLKVKAVISSTVITITDGNDVDIVPSTTATHTDLDTRTTGNQLAYCGRTTATGLNPHPRGWWQNSGPFATQIKDPDGAGSAVAPVVALDPVGWAALVAENTASSTATCDGSTAALCPTEETIIVQQTRQIQEMWPTVTLALGWHADNSKTAWLASARYFLNNIHRASPYQDFPGMFASADMTANEGGRGEDTDLVGLVMTHTANVFSLIRSQMSAGEISALANKLYRDEVDGCTPQLPPLSGAVSMAPSSSTVTGVGFSAHAVGDVIYIKDKHRLFGIDDGSLVSIGVAGTVGTITLGTGQPLPSASSSITIAGSTISGLDGNYLVSAPSGVTFTIVVAGVANGTYSTAGMTVRAFAPSDSTGVWKKVTAIASDTSMTVTPANGTTRITNSPYSKVMPWTPTTCGLHWFGLHHTYAPVQQDTRFINTAATIQPNATSFVVSTGTYDNIKDKALPWTLNSNGEIMEVTAKNDGTRTLTITRGMFLSPPEQHLTSAYMYYQPTGPNTSMVTTAILRSYGDVTANLTHRKIVGIVNSASLLLEDSPGAVRAFEYYWNLYMDSLYRYNAATWQGFTLSGPGSPGYYFGSWADLFAFTALTAKNTLNPPMDLVTKFPGMCGSAIGALHLSRGENHANHLSWSDSGSSRFWETDDLKILEASAYLCPAESPLLLYYTRNVLAFTNKETVPFRLAYFSNTTTDYKTVLPTKRVFTANPPHPYGIGGATFRQSWTPGTATVGFISALQGGDHVGTYPFPGGLILAKGGTELICGSATACAGMSDARENNSVSIRVPPTAESPTGGLTAPAGYSPTNGPAYISRSKIGTDYMYVRVLNQRYNTTVAVTSAHRDVLYLDGAQDYAVTYDRNLKPSGREDNFRVPYYRADNVSGAALQSPVPTYSRNGDSIQFASNQYGQSVRTKILYPTTATAVFTEDNTLPKATRFSVTTTTSEGEFFAIHAPCATTNCPEPAWNLLASAAAYRIGQIDDGTNVWITGFAKSPTDASTSVTYTALPYTGAGKHAIAGLPASTAWTVSRDGTVVTTISTDENGILRFDATRGTSGAFTIGIGTPPPPLSVVVNQATGETPCTTGDLNNDGVCNVLDVVRWLIGV